MTFLPFDGIFFPLFTTLILSFVTLLSSSPDEEDPSPSSLDSSDELGFLAFINGLFVDFTGALEAGIILESSSELDSSSPEEDY